MADTRFGIESLRNAYASYVAPEEADDHDFRQEVAKRGYEFLDQIKAANKVLYSLEMPVTERNVSNFSKDLYSISFSKQYGLKDASTVFEILSKNIERKHNRYQPKRKTSETVESLSGKLLWSALSLAEDFIDECGMDYERRLKVEKARSLLNEMCDIMRSAIHINSLIKKQLEHSNSNILISDLVFESINDCCEEHEFGGVKGWARTNPLEFKPKDVRHKHFSGCGPCDLHSSEEYKDSCIQDVSKKSIEDVLNEI